MVAIMINQVKCALTKYNDCIECSHMLHYKRKTCPIYQLLVKAMNRLNRLGVYID